MTFIQPTIQKSINLFRITFVAMIGLILVGVIALVMLYNQTVAARHASRDLQNHIVALESDNADRQQQLMAQLDTQTLAARHASRGMVEDRTPQYLTATHDTWVFASRF